jgi:hypothetical protein
MAREATLGGRGNWSFEAILEKSSRLALSDPTDI